MSKLLKPLAIVLFLSTSLFTTLQAQDADSMSKLDMFIGQWETEDSFVKMVFFKDRNNQLQMVAWDTNDGEEMVIEKLEIDGDDLKTTEKMVSSDWTTYNTYIIVDENTIKNVIDGDAGGVTIMLTRLK